MLKKKRLVVVASILVLGCMSFVIGAWLLGYQSPKITGNVVGTSGSPLFVTGEFETEYLINTSEGSSGYEDQLNLRNDNGILDMNVSLLINVTDVEDGCYDFEDDCVTFVRFRAGGMGYMLVDGGNITLPVGVSNFYLNTTCKIFSCPQKIEVDLALFPLN